MAAVTLCSDFGAQENKNFHCFHFSHSICNEKIGLDEAQAGIKIAGRNINNLRYAADTTFMAENKELKSLWIKVKEESENEN